MPTPNLHKVLCTKDFRRFLLDARLVAPQTAPTYRQVSLADDTLAIRVELTRQVEYEGENVVMVIYSYGGPVDGEAIAEDLTWAKRLAQSPPGGVIHHFIYATSLLNEIQLVLSASSLSPLNDVKIRTTITEFACRKSDLTA